MILVFTVKTCIIIFILLVVIFVLSFILRKKIMEDDFNDEITNTMNLNIDELKRQDMKDTMNNIKENTSFVPNEDDEEKSTEYNANREEKDEDLDDLEII